MHSMLCRAILHSVLWLWSLAVPDMGPRLCESPEPFGSCAVPTADSVLGWGGTELQLACIPCELARGILHKSAERLKTVPEQHVVLCFSFLGWSSSNGSDPNAFICSSLLPAVLCGHSAASLGLERVPCVASSATSVLQAFALAGILLVQVMGQQCWG